MGDVWASGEENVSVSKSRETLTCVGAVPLDRAEEEKCGMEKLLEFRIGIVFSELVFVTPVVFSELGCCVCYSCGVFRAAIC